MQGMHALVISVRAVTFTEIIARVSSDDSPSVVPNLPTPAQLTRSPTSGDSSETIPVTASMPSSVERSAVTILQGVSRESDSPSSLPALLATIHSSSNPRPSMALQKQAPRPEEAPVTMAIIGSSRRPRR